MKLKSEVNNLLNYFIDVATSSAHLLGEKRCTYGPSYWCQNLTNAGDCHATKHCIQTVWIHKTYPEDTTSICDTCKEMVKEARDQLESNETQELIKEVFEGSCALLRVKPIVVECDKIADNYIPDLIDTLASEMNPQTVCAVAGLCNNGRITQMLEEAQELSKKPAELEPKNSRCENCNTVMDIVVNKFNAMEKNDFLKQILQVCEVCGEFSSFSDACSNQVITNFEDLYSFLKQNFNSNDFCLLSGECYTNFHKHHVEITPMSKIGYVPVKNEQDDLPCELCEQLVTHLREVLIANTTEAEFKLVLEGLCKQAKKSFSTECLSIVDQYYDMIYQYVVTELNSTTACTAIGICPSNEKQTLFIAPLLPVENVPKAVKLNQEAKPVTIPNDDLVVKVIKPKQEAILSAVDMQLPIDLLVPPHQQVYNQQFCIFCQYFLHYLQNEITDPTVESDVKKVIDKACSKLPRSVNETCVEFVNTYEPAMVAILAQEIDPSQICPLLKACPKDESKDVDIFMTAQSSEKCPLCLLTVTKLESMIKGKATKDEIKESLEKVCNHLPGNLKPECTDFVNTYTDELIEMLMADFKPEEVCVYLKLCTDKSPADFIISKDPHEEFRGDTETNAIFDDTVEGHQVEMYGTESCILCEFVMKEVDDKLKDQTVQADIKEIVHDICKALPGTVKDSCNKFVSQYADMVIILLEEALDPKEICTYMKFCKPKHALDFIRDEVSKCSGCKSTAQVMNQVLQNPKVARTMENIFSKTCRGMPSSDMKKSCFTTFFKNGELEYEAAYLILSDLASLQVALAFQPEIADCVICKAIVKGVRELIKNNKTKDAIQKALRQVCKKVHSHKCRDIVNKHFDQFVNLILAGTKSGKICSLISLCTGNPTTAGHLHIL
ncbi:hypothetical protein D910_09549 [Dendroctonus ponderosae]|uniref:Pulmonary surfactant-associated protein B n=1 Tax=Dendroctonus ponderosae TaxID=77166 RepID=U4UQ14_DENPD|nr:hypothetical protein D910_09549 [Dendroctonus ponderosae]